jgi:cytochrome c oxidase subunit II
MGNFPLRPDNASTFANEHDALFGLITALTIFFTVVVLALVIFFAVKYRRGSKADRSRPQHENLKLEIAWSVFPLILALGVFAWGARLFVHMRTPPKDAIEIFVIGKQWMWHVQHQNGVRENNMLTIPVNKPVKLTMISQDVIHAFYVPEFRSQYMVVPGRYTQQWFEPTKVGTYKILCNMYCGTSHSEMVGHVRVLSQSDYQRWLEGGGEEMKAASLTIEDRGRDLYNELVCTNCHMEKDNPRGPSLYALAGSRRVMNDNRVVDADDDYLRDAITHAGKTIVKGYDDTMPDYSDLTEEQVLWLLAYMKSLGNPRTEGGATPEVGPASTLPNSVNKPNNTRSR